jgi:hypothetical protein
LSISVTRREGVDAGMRDLVNAVIAQSVWTQLAVAAFGSVQIDEDTSAIVHPTTEWKKEIIERFMPVLYPDQDADAALDGVVRAFRGEGGLEDFVGRLGTVVQENIGTHRPIESALRARDREAREMTESQS